MQFYLAHHLMPERRHIILMLQESNQAKLAPQTDALSIKLSVYRANFEL